jgi:hypothetical protein
LHDGFFERLAVQRGRGAAASAVNAFAHQAKAVGVHTGRGQAQYHVTGLNILAGENFGFFHGTDGKAGQVVLAIGVHAGHFGGFATDQGAARQLAALGNAANDGSGRVHVQLAAGKVIEEEQRLSPLDQHVIDAHGHQVDADGVVHIPLKSQFQLGAYAVGAADQDGLLVALGHFKQSAKTANAGQYAFAHGLLGQGLDAFDQCVASINIDASVFVGEGGGAHVGGRAGGQAGQRRAGRCGVKLPR